MTGLRQFQIRLSNGLSLDGAEQGPGWGPALLLVHGYSDSWRSFRPLLAEMPSEIRCVAVSLRGHGDSSKPTTGYAMADFAGDLDRLLSQLAIERAVIVGHSMGSVVARRLALDHPHRVRGLVLIGAFPTLKGKPAIEQLWCDSIATMREPVDPAFVRAFQESTLVRAVPPDYFESVVAESLKLPAQVWRQAMRSMLDEDHGAELMRVGVPTLILWGDKDGICDRADQTLLLEAIPGASLTIHDDTGHAPHWESPRRVAGEIAAFLDKVEKTPKPSWSSPS